MELSILSSSAQSGSSSNSKTPIRNSTATIIQSTSTATILTQESPERFPKYMRILILAGVILASSTAVISGTIDQRALHEITASSGPFIITTNNIDWHSSAYFLATTLCGTLYTLFNTGCVYLVALVVFEVGVILCPTSINATMFNLGRVATGASSAALFNGGMIIIGLTVPLRYRPAPLALVPTMFGIFPILGPIIGQGITARLSWKWCYWVELLFTAVVLVIIFVSFKKPKQRHAGLAVKTKLASLDLPGAILFTGGMTCLLLALHWSRTLPSSNLKLVASLIGFVLMTLIFAGIQSKCGDKSTIPPQIIKQPNIFIGCIFTAMISMILFAHISYLQYFGVLADYPANHYMIPYLASKLIVSLGVGIAITLIGYWPSFAFAGSFSLIIHCSLLTLIKTTDKKGTQDAYQLIIGIAAGNAIQIPFLDVHAVLSNDDIPKGIALITFFNALGGIVASPIARAIFNTSAQEVEEILRQVGNSTNWDQSGTGEVDLIIKTQEKHLSHVFILPVVAACVAFLCSFLFGWMNLKRRKGETRS